MEPLTYVFENLSNGGNQYTWHFSSTIIESTDEEDVTYTFPAPGTYDVTLVGSNSDGANCSSSQVIVE